MSCLGCIPESPDIIFYPTGNLASKSVTVLMNSLAKMTFLTVQTSFSPCHTFYRHAKAAATRHGFCRSALHRVADRVTLPSIWWRCFEEPIRDCVECERACVCLEISQPPLRDICGAQGSFETIPPSRKQSIFTFLSHRCLCRDGVACGRGQLQLSSAKQQNPSHQGNK